MKTESQKKPTAREALKALTETVKPLVVSGEYENVNSAILSTYKNSEHQVFKTYHGWRKENMQVVKHSKSFLVWAKPQEIIEHQTDKVTGRIFPVAYLFSNAQVIQREVKKEVERQNDQEKTEEFRKIRMRKADKNPEMER